MTTVTARPPHTDARVIVFELPDGRTLETFQCATCDRLFDAIRWAVHAGISAGQTAMNGKIGGISEAPRIAPETPLTTSPDITRKGPRSW